MNMLLINELGAMLDLIERQIGIMNYRKEFNRHTWESISKELSEMRREMTGYSIKLRKLNRTVKLRLARGEKDERYRRLNEEEVISIRNAELKRQWDENDSDETQQGTESSKDS